MDSHVCFFPDMSGLQSCCKALSLSRRWQVTRGRGGNLDVLVAVVHLPVEVVLPDAPWGVLSSGVPRRRRASVVAKGKGKRRRRRSHLLLDGRRQRVRPQRFVPAAGESPETEDAPKLASRLMEPISGMMIARLDAGYLAQLQSQR